jgi:hypothetical protein
MSNIRNQPHARTGNGISTGKVLPGRWVDNPASGENGSLRLAWENSHALQARARQLQARAMRDLGRSLARGAATGARWLGSGAASWLLAVGEALAAKRAYEELSRLSDRQLFDMGLTRDDLAAVAWGELHAARREEDAPEAAEDIAQRFRKAA